MVDVSGDLRPAKDTLVETFSTFGGDALRDVWLFDQKNHEVMYLRDDVEQKVAEVEVGTFVDNERFGYITRDTYADLYYAAYEYTVRGFDEFELFRTFLSNEGAKIGVFASFDTREGGYDYDQLDETIADIVDDYPIESFAPE